MSSDDTIPYPDDVYIDGIQYDCIDYPPIACDVDIADIDGAVSWVAFKTVDCYDQLPSYGCVSADNAFYIHMDATTHKEVFDPLIINYNHDRISSVHLICARREQKRVWVFTNDVIIYVETYNGVEAPEANDIRDLLTLYGWMLK